VEHPSEIASINRTDLHDQVLSFGISTIFGCHDRARGYDAEGGSMGEGEPKGALARPVEIRHAEY
jgi:hypothetical protein